MAMVALLVSDLADAFNIGKNMSAAQVTDTALLIVTNYSDLKLDDIAFCFTKAKMGRYGKLYDRLDSGVIFEWIDMFIADKLEQIDYYWQHQQMTIKSQNETLLIDAPKAADNDTALKHIKAIKSKVIEIQRKNYKVKNIINEPVEENLVQQIHNKWMMDFKDLWEIESWASDEVLKGTRFVTKYGRKLDVMEYIQRKHYQFSMLIEKIHTRWNCL